MDLIYPYHNDKRTGEMCLKYSLRSVDMYLGQAIDNVYIIGDKTDFKNVIHVPVTDYMSQARNIWAKILTAAKTWGVSENFMVMSDDHFITKPQPAVFNKNKIIELHEAYPLSDGNIGFVTKSLYFNHFGMNPSVQIKDCKIRQNYSHEEIEGKIGSRDCFSTGKEDSCPNIVSYLESKYPNKSKYE